MADQCLNKGSSISAVDKHLVVDKKSADTEHDDTEGKLKRDMQLGNDLSNKKQKITDNDVVGSVGNNTTYTMVTCSRHGTTTAFCGSIDNLEEVRASVRRSCDKEKRSESEEIDYDSSDDDTDDRTVPYYKSSSSEDAGEQLN